ncbi:lactose-binding lectin l-2-like [Amphiprion ocellaris]|uniref:C-type lectin domain-containing protein n=1 Tax=Amphiprion ocellaris TaxID=80972 RepID=A0A3Q1D273_AMPOC|nr:lactose-binding lectin l-2-like [Amphiprion ocellaris]XP_054873919.1 lactose-binding lectin l-2-like [Amphiprion ocellaris]
MILLLFLIGLALGDVTPPDDHEVMHHQGNCSMFWSRFNGRFYKYISTRMTWADAELHCVSEGANLVSIHSIDEHNFVNSLIKTYDPARTRTWIGLSDVHKEGAWLWSDGSKVNFVFWNTGQPDNAGGQEHCGHTNHGAGFKWNDVPCSRTKPFVCASRTVCS